MHNYFATPTTATPAMGCIKVLDEAVVQRIAAGEVLQRPVNAVKELLENSLDAGATRITISVQVPSSGSECGLFSLSVADNGHGIWRDDLPLLCERHATSKLSCVAELGQVQTFGFRGEALASCAQVARVQVLTRRREAEDGVAWRVEYLQGKMQAEPEAVAGNIGTTIQVNDLFYANRVRREALQKSPEEYAKILQVVQYYALDRASSCAFSLHRRANQLRSDAQTDLQMDHLGVARVLFGDAIASALMPFTIDAQEELGLLRGCRGWATRTTFHGLKAATVIIFLNGRLIEHVALRRAMLQAFAAHLPTSPPAQPFIYLSLQVKGSRVDVNVHPSKRQVFLLDEDEVIKAVLRALDEQILSRQYQTQAMQSIVIDNKSNSKSTNSIKNPRMKPSNELYPSQRVLTDAKNSKIDSFLFHSSSQDTTSNNTSWSPLLKRARVEKENVKESSLGTENLKMSSLGKEMTTRDSITSSDGKKTTEPIALTAPIVPNEPIVPTVPIAPIAPKETIQLTKPMENPDPISSSKSPWELLEADERDSLLSASNAQVSSLLCSSVVVGVIDSQWSLLQSGTRLLLADHLRLALEMFFWKSLQGKHVESMNLHEPCSIEECFPGDEAVQKAACTVLQSAIPVLEAFGIVIIGDNASLSLSALPQLIPAQRFPPRQNILTFLTRLCLLPECSVLAIAGELAKLYASSLDCSLPDWPEYLKHCWLPALKDSQVHYTLQENVLQIITDTETLYRSFERC